MRLPLHDFQVFSEKKKKNRDTAIKAAANCLVLGRLKAEDSATTSFLSSVPAWVQNKGAKLNTEKKEEEKKSELEVLYNL